MTLIQGGGRGGRTGDCGGPRITVVGTAYTGASSSSVLLSNLGGLSLEELANVELDEHDPLKEEEQEPE